MNNTTYEPGFKEQALKMAAESGAAQAARDLGVPVGTIYGWQSHEKRKNNSNTRIGSWF